MAFFQVRLWVAIFAAIPLVATVLLPTNANAAKGLKIIERTKYYRISGKTASDFARSMSRRGPFSLQHRKRAWATASRDMTYQLVRKKGSKGCRMIDAKVDMKIVYTLPKLSSVRGVTKRHQKRWRLMSNLLVKHEKTHGRFYKEFARKVHRQLRRLPRARNCRQLDRNAARLVARLSEEDSERNNLFDARDQRNYSRMTRLYSLR